MKPKVEGKVRVALESELEDGIEMMKKEFHEKIAEDRENWMQERV